MSMRGNCSQGDTKGSGGSTKAAHNHDFGAEESSEQGSDGCQSNAYGEGRRRSYVLRKAPSHQRGYSVQIIYKHHRYGG